jgi:DNA-binding transcriptional MerR regulator
MAEKSADAFRTISEVADDLQVPQHVLRFWEGRFPQIKPVKRAGGRRYYRPEDVDLLAKIRDLLYKQGLTIKGVQAILKEGGVDVIPMTDEPSASDQAIQAGLPISGDGESLPYEAGTFDEEEDLQESAPTPEPPLTVSPAIVNEQAPLLQPSLPGLGISVPAAPKLPELTRKELSQILQELEQLRFLLRP